MPRALELIPRLSTRLTPLLVFLNSKTKIKSARPGKNGKRWYKDVGLGFRTPKTAIEGNYIGTSNESRWARDFERTPWDRLAVSQITAG